MSERQYVFSFKQAKCVYLICGLKAEDFNIEAWSNGQIKEFMNLIMTEQDKNTAERLYNKIEEKNIEFPQWKPFKNKSKFQKSKTVANMVNELKLLIKDGCELHTFMPLFREYLKRRFYFIKSVTHKSQRRTVKILIRDDNKYEKNKQQLEEVIEFFIPQYPHANSQTDHTGPAVLFIDDIEYACPYQSFDIRKY